MGAKRTKGAKTGTKNARGKNRPRGHLIPARANDVENPLPSSDAIFEIASKAPQGKFMASLVEESKTRLVRRAGAPMWVVREFLPELFEDNSKHLIHLAGNVPEFTAGNGRYLTFFTRVLPGFERISFEVFSRQKPTVKGTPPHVLALPAQKLITKDWTVDALQDGTPDAVLIWSRSKFADDSEIGLHAANGSNVTNVMFGFDSEVEAVNFVLLLHGHGFDASYPRPFATNAERVEHNSYGTWWVRIANPAGLKLRRWDPNLLTNVAAIDDLMSKALEDADDAGEKALFEHFAKEGTGTVSGEERETLVWLSHLEGVDVAKGQFFARDSLDADWEWRGEFLAAGLQDNYLIADDPAAPEARLARQRWLGQVHAARRQAVVESVAVVEPEPIIAETLVEEAVSPVRPAVEEEVAVDDVAPELVLTPFNLEPGAVNVLAVSGRVSHAHGADHFRGVIARFVNWLTRKGFPGVTTNTSYQRELAGGEATIETDGEKLWALRFDDRTRIANGAFWRVEATVLNATEIAIGLRVTQIRSSADAALPETGVPKPITEITEHFNMSEAGLFNRTTAKAIRNEVDFEKLITALRNPDRTQSIVMVNAAQENNVDASCDRLAKKLVGVARVFWINYEFEKSLVNALGSECAAEGGTIRLFLPNLGIAREPRPYHTYAYRGRVIPKGDVEDLALKAFQASVLGDLDERVPQFNQVLRLVSDARVRKVQARHSELATSAAEEREQQKEVIAAMLRSQEQMEQQLKEYELKIHELQSMYDGVVFERTQLRSEKKALLARIRELTQVVEDVPVEVDEVEFPSTWDDLDAWLEVYGNDRIVVLDSAVRAARASSFPDIAFCYRALHYLIAHYHAEKNRSPEQIEIRERSQDALRDLGLESSRVGSAVGTARYGDDYVYDYDGRKVTMDLHLKRGGGMDEKRFFRMYFCYDEITDKVVVGYFPGHLTNRLTHNS